MALMTDFVDICVRIRTKRRGPATHIYTGGRLKRGYANFDMQCKKTI